MTRRTLIALTFWPWFAPAAGAAPPRDMALLYAIERVEDPSGDPAAIGDRGEAVGVLQIHPIMVAEANRLRKSGARAFTLEDRRNPARSEEMFWTVADSYGAVSREVIARRWNGGRRGERKAATAAYWKKVQKELGK